MTLWFWFAIGASMLWGLSYVLSQYVLRTLNPIEILLIISSLMVIILSTYLSVAHQWHSLFSKFTHGYKLPLTLIAYALIYGAASLFILQSVRLGDASLAAVVESSYPIFTMLFAYMLLKETQINWGIIMGTVLVISGLGLIYFNSSKLPPMH